MDDALKLKDQGLQLFQDGLYQEAVDKFERALEIFEQNDDPLNAAEMLNNIGVIHREEGNLEAARDALQRAVERFANANDTERQGQAVGNLALVYKKLDNYEEAVTAYKEASQLLGSTNANEQQGEVLMALGLMQFNQGDRMAGLANYEAGVMKLERPTMRHKAVQTLLKLRNSLQGGTSA